MAQQKKLLTYKTFYKLMEKEIRNAYVFLREKNNTVPSEVLDFMLHASLEKLKETNKEQDAIGNDFDLAKWLKEEISYRKGLQFKSVDGCEQKYYKGQADILQVVLNQTVVPSKQDAIGNVDEDIFNLAQKYANLSHEDFDGNIDLHYQNGFIAGYMKKQSQTVANVDSDAISNVDEEDIRQLAIKKYGNNPHSFGGQRDGFVEGYKAAKQCQVANVDSDSINDKQLWARVINDARWYDGSPQMLEQLIQHFKKNDIHISNSR